MRQNGIINADEWRAIENMNPLPNGKGKTYFINGAMIPTRLAAQGRQTLPAPALTPAEGENV
jgi:hypothetical protein